MKEVFRFPLDLFRFNCFRIAWDSLPFIAPLSMIFFCHSMPWSLDWCLQSWCSPLWNVRERPDPERLEEQTKYSRYDTKMYVEWSKEETRDRRNGQRLGLNWCLSPWGTIFPWIGVHVLISALPRVSAYPPGYNVKQAPSRISAPSSLFFSNSRDLFL